MKALYGPERAIRPAGLFMKIQRKTTLKTKDDNRSDQLPPKKGSNLMKNTNNNYMKNFMTATARAAKVTGVDVAGVRANFRKFKDAPSEYKHALIVAYRIMDAYNKAAKAEEPATEAAEQ